MLYFLQVWINQGDIILLSLREFQDDKADVIVKYTADEARSLKAYGYVTRASLSGPSLNHVARVQRTTRDCKDQRNGHFRRRGRRLHIRVWR